MKFCKLGIVAASLVMMMVSSANAKTYHHRHHHRYSHHIIYRVSHHVNYRHHHNRIRYADGRPNAWCGWYMAHKLGIGGSEGRRLWLAANWAKVGQRTSPVPGAVVVWAHHVGQLVRHVAGSIWVVNSGNDGHAVRTRPRSIAGAIAFRRV